MNMWTPLIIVGVFVLLPVVYVVVTYNTLVALRNHIRDAWSNIDTELKRRYDLIPNLVATVKGYAAHEKEIFERVTELRARCMASQGRPKNRRRTRTCWWPPCSGCWWSWRITRS